jgi:lipopolysaccharide transport system ATP-binding protein
MSTELAIKVEGVGKYYHVYDQPADRLKQAVVPRLERVLGKSPRQYGRLFWALRDVTFDVLRGETVGIIGRNGSGKSTMLQIVCGTLSPSTGSVTVNGRVAALLELGSGFNPEFTGRDNVYMNAAVLGLTPEEVDARYEAIADFAGIGDFINQPVKTYSSGMVVRLAFAVSVSVAPDILVIDEALAVGDMAFQQKCLQRLNDLREAGVTVLLVTHDIMLTRNYCSRVVYLDGGCVRAIGDAEAVGEQYLMDARVSNQKEAGRTVEWKAGAGKLRFGAEAGSITRMTMSGARSAGSVFEPGELMTITLEARVSPEIRNPQLGVQFRDARGYVLYGRSTSPADLDSRLEGSDRYISAVFEMPSAFGPGEYAVTVSLNDRHSDDVTTMLDKVVSAAQFTVPPMPGRRSHGPVDLGGRWRASENA